MLWHHMGAWHTTAYSQRPTDSQFIDFFFFLFNLMCLLDRVNSSRSVEFTLGISGFHNRPLSPHDKGSEKHYRNLVTSRNQGAAEAKVRSRAWDTVWGGGLGGPQRLSHPHILVLGSRE